MESAALEATGSLRACLVPPRHSKSAAAGLSFRQEFCTLLAGNQRRDSGSVDLYRHYGLYPEVLSRSPGEWYLYVECKTEHEQEPD